jgi:type II secretory pathway component PulC
VTPADAGLSLLGTVIGPRRTALISGKVYQVGREVESKDGYVFLVKDIQSRRIVLERDGQQFELEMARSRSADSTNDATNSKTSTPTTSTSTTSTSTTLTTPGKDDDQ